ncbi:MAG: energy-coupling factor ABC transporter permease [Thermoguttaceae bacterium]
MNKRMLLIGGVFLAAVVFWPAPAQAMHISEGILPPGPAGLWFLVAAPFWFWGLHTIQRRRAADPSYTTLVALVGAAIFVISCMHVPIAGTGSCSHALGVGLGALLIGPGPTVVAVSIALLLQALFLAHGGLTSLGANIVSMGVVGAFSAYCLFRVLRWARVPAFAAAFLAGVLSDWATYATTAFQLASGTHDNASIMTMFLAYGALFVPTQVPLGIADGVMAAVAHRFVRLRRPELLGLPPQAALVAGEKT